MKLGFIFAGQGAQYVGMGKELYEQYEVARDVFNQAHIDIDVKKVCFEGPEDILNETSYAQPCLLLNPMVFILIMWLDFL